MAHQFAIIPTGKALGADVVDFDIKAMDQGGRQPHPRRMA